LVFHRLHYSTFSPLLLSSLSPSTLFFLPSFLFPRILVSPSFKLLLSLSCCSFFLLSFSSYFPLVILSSLLFFLQIILLSQVRSCTSSFCCLFFLFTLLLFLLLCCFSFFLFGLSSFYLAIYSPLFIFLLPFCSLFHSSCILFSHLFIPPSLLLFIPFILLFLLLFSYSFFLVVLCSIPVSHQWCDLFH
jgi:hypothetical protein